METRKEQSELEKIQVSDVKDIVEEEGAGQHKWNTQTCPWAVRNFPLPPRYTQALAGAEARLHGAEEWEELWRHQAWPGTKRGKGQ